MTHIVTLLGESDEGASEEIADALREIAAKADNGRISIEKVDAAQRELLSMYSEANDAWQEVVKGLFTDEVLSVSQNKAGDIYEVWF